MNAAVVLDASALLALMDAEPGEDAVAAVLPGALLSSVNLAEVGSKLAERGMPAAQAHADALALGIEVVAFDGDLARGGGSTPATHARRRPVPWRPLLARSRNASVLTTETRWEPMASVVGVAIRNIRARLV